MPRKSPKTASEAPTAQSQGVDTSAQEKIAQNPEKQEAQGNPLEPPAKKKTGRPSKYTPELAAEICERISNGEPLRQICRDDHMPNWSVVYDWMARDEDLSQRIAHAREQGFEAIAEEALVIADNPHFGQKQVFGDDKTYTTVEDMLGHRKLQIETRLKLLAKWNPKKYGDRVTHAGDPEAPLQVNNDAVALLTEAVKNLELRRNGS